jgi:hypothetical protein
VVKIKEEKEQGQVLGSVHHRPDWVLYLSIGIRAAHQVGAAIFLAGFLLGWEHQPRNFYIYLTVFTGLVLCCTEMSRHRQLFREVAGVATVAKCLLIGLAFHGFLWPSAVVLLGFVLASLAAHAPKNIRHRMLW